MRRTGRVFTGVDRVELAYLRAIWADPVPAFALIRAPLGYILLDQAGLGAIKDFLETGSPDTDPERGRDDVWRLARRVSIGRVPPFFLARMLKRNLPQNVAYLNVGHSNLTERVLRTLRDANEARITVFLHDVIPLEYPEYQREGTVAPFEAMLERVANYADLIVYNSHDTKKRVQSRMHSMPKSIVSHLGTDPVEALPDEIPESILPTDPYFMCIGTIEPRKNHGFLLDIWNEMGADAPNLVIAGPRGWKNEGVFERLDGLRDSKTVFEVSGLSDGVLAALLDRSAGLVFPSHAEGYGLPAVEAAARGVPLILNDLPVFRELLGEIPVYASVSDRYLWINTIKTLAQTKPATSENRQFQPPTWDAHFKTVLRLT